MKGEIVARAGEHIEIAVDYFDGTPLVHLKNKRTGAFFTVSIAYAADLVAGVNRAIAKVVDDAKGSPR